ncbi:ribulose-phosphate 3-epimerase [Patescibacteria group bacterium]|nr:ribulose-phosphate 3-epimerase [Patescibacteria group bacterium]
MKQKITLAILTNNLTDFKNKIVKIENIVDWIQIDIMDKKFVDNSSVNLNDLINIKLNFNIEVHLMTLNPEKYLEACKQIKAKRVIFHYEAVNDVSFVLERMNKYDFKKGIAINPNTEVAKIKPFLNQVDAVLFLGVKPGFGGQEFQLPVLAKIKKLRKFNSNIKIGVDGGINLTNISEIKKAGADYLVIGSGVFNSKNISSQLNLLKNK